MSVNMFEIDFGAIFIIVVVVLIVLLSAVLFYQVKLIRNISFLKNHAKKIKESKEEQQEAQDPILAAVIIAAINLHKSK